MTSVLPRIREQFPHMTDAQFASSISSLPPLSRGSQQSLWHQISIQNNQPRTSFYSRVCATAKKAVAAVTNCSIHTKVAAGVTASAAVASYTAVAYRDPLLTTKVASSSLTAIFTAAALSEQRAGHPFTAKLYGAAATVAGAITAGAFAWENFFQNGLEVANPVSLPPEASPEISETVDGSEMESTASFAAQEPASSDPMSSEWEEIDPKIDPSESSPPVAVSGEPIVDENSGVSGVLPEGIVHTYGNDTAAFVKKSSAGLSTVSDEMSETVEVVTLPQGESWMSAVPNVSALAIGTLAVGGIAALLFYDCLTPGRAIPHTVGLRGAPVGPSGDGNGGTGGPAPSAIPPSNGGAGGNGSSNPVSLASGLGNPAQHFLRSPLRSSSSSASTPAAATPPRSPCGGGSSSSAVAHIDNRFSTLAESEQSQSPSRASRSRLSRRKKTSKYENVSVHTCENPLQTELLLLKVELSLLSNRQTEIKQELEAEIEKLAKLGVEVSQDEVERLTNVYQSIQSSQKRQTRSSRNEQPKQSSVEPTSEERELCNLVRNSNDWNSKKLHAIRLVSQQYNSLVEKNEKLFEQILLTNFSLWQVIENLFMQDRSLDQAFIDKVKESLSEQDVEWLQMIVYAEKAPSEGQLNIESLQAAVTLRLTYLNDGNEVYCSHVRAYPLINGGLLADFRKQFHFPLIPDADETASGTAFSPSGNKPWTPVKTRFQARLALEGANDG